MFEQQLVEAQAALDELFRENVLPFKLSAYRVDSEGNGSFAVFFYDSRLPRVDVSHGGDQSFKSIVRAAVLDKLRIKVSTHKGAA